MWPTELYLRRLIVVLIPISSLTLWNIQKPYTEGSWKQHASQSTAASNDPSPKPHASFDLHEASTKLFAFPCSPTRVGPMSFKSVDRQCSSPQAYVRSCTIVTDRRGIQLFVWTRHTIKCQWSKGSLCACDALTRRSVILVPLGEIPSQVWVITLCCWCFKNLCRSESFVQIEERRFNTRRYVYWTY